MKLPAAPQRILAWGLGFGGAIACVVTVWLTVALGLYSVHVLFYGAFIGGGVLGALIAAREPRNSVGWLMCAASLAATLFYLPIDYAYLALVLEPASWPLGRIALWLGAWAWAPLLGLFLPVLTVRFPDGKTPRRWRAVDWLAISGASTVAMAAALAPSSVLAHFLRARGPLSALPFQNPTGATLPEVAANVTADLGLALMLLAYLVAVISVIDRYRHASEEKRLQLKWFAYAGMLVTVAEIYGAVVLVGGWELGAEFDVIVHLSTSALPIAIAIAILHHRLYDIDILINRTLVYGGLTAILAATYTAGITLLQRLFMAVSGQRSDSAYVLTAFAIVVGFTPVKNWLQAQVDRRIGAMSPTAVLNEFTTEVEAVVSVIDVERVACRLLDRAVKAFDARGAELYLHSNAKSKPLYRHGSLSGGARLEVPIRYGSKQFGKLLLGSRRDGFGYTQRDRAELQRSADSVGEAIALAENLGFRSLARAR